MTVEPVSEDDAVNHLASYTTNDPGHTPWLPGYPDLEMDKVELLSAFLADDLECKELDQMSDCLWLLSTQSSENISQLHRQRVKGREIILTEEPKLHLIWFYDKIHIKPMPRYLLSRSFWQQLLLDPQQPLALRHNIILTSALGFLRSYAHLIRYESDFRIAKDNTLALIPDFVSWEQWRLLRAQVLVVRDEEVSARFRFGEIRLTRLNFYCKFLLFETYYYRTHRQYGDYFASFYPSLLFLFGIISIMLGAMQLAATVEQLDEQWRCLLGLFRMFSVVTMVITFLLLATLLVLFAIKITNEWIFALRCRYSRGPRKSGTRLNP
ncbi:uncharacterized protein BDZ99DRAFT_488383 [Mytilinidion resinicola]|uniref:Subtilisin-like serine protease n=1 Tax=Mytilinidion resinicola TaxID=574789 RepID=A0A6A6YLG1_9PEZI|nr:uncharacterized protein BDZ99DRAFT_488383 [Mytilinidion resinicola]KAF2809379.1 hypothetical protein BDZ99DRAFT_488383 [Mytilinidion resinicola]